MGAFDVNCLHKKLFVMKKSKYNNIKTVIDGITFDSKREARRYSELKLMQAGNLISDLRLQVPYVLVEAQKGGIRKELALKYLADFVYYNKLIKDTIIEDVKGVKTPIYIAKRKMMKALGLEITEIN